MIGQLVLIVVAALYGAGILWMRSLARFQAPERLLAAGTPPAARRGSRGAVTAWRGGAAMTVPCSSRRASPALGLFLLGYALRPPRLRLSRQLAAFDAARRGAKRPLAGGRTADGNGLRGQLGGWLARLCAEQGLGVPLGPRPTCR